jgi:Flp pilus assembly protein TadD
MIEALTRQGRLGEALEETESALKVIRRDPKLCQHLATLLLRSGHQQRAARACRKWIRVEPDSPLPHNALGVYCLDIGDYDLARRHFLQAVELKPTYWLAHINLARTYVALGEDAAALGQLGLVLDGAPGGPERQAAEAMRARILEEKKRD